MNVVRGDELAVIRQALFTLLKHIIDGEWGPYPDDYYWPMVDQAIRDMRVDDLIAALSAARQEIEELHGIIGVDRLADYGKL